MENGWADCRARTHHRHFESLIGPNGARAILMLLKTARDSTTCLAATSGFAELKGRLELI